MAIVYATPPAKEEDAPSVVEICRGGGPV